MKVKKRYVAVMLAIINVLSVGGDIGSHVSAAELSASQEAAAYFCEDDGLVEGSEVSLKNYYMPSLAFGG